MSCLTCTKETKFKCSDCNIPFCNNQICQVVHHLYYDQICGKGTKRDRSPSPDPLKVDLIYLQAVAVVRKSGLCNMIVDLDCVFVSMLCVLHIWDHSRQASEIVGKKDEIMKIMNAWRTIDSEQRAYIDASIDGMPFSGDYLDAAGRWNKDNTSEELIRYLEQRDYHHGENWAKFLVEYAKEECYQHGIFLRDRVKIESLRGVFDPNRLMIAGAQFPKRTHGK